MMSCFGFGKSEEEREREPLLPLYNDDTALQTRLHEKLHTYQMLRAMYQGYMPSNEQVIIHLRSLLSSDALTMDSTELSESGRALIRSTRLLIKQTIELLQHKNSEDQIQDFIWYLTKARLDVDLADIESRASKARVKADTVAAYRSLQTVGSLLMTNSDFRVFLGDLETVGREVFRDTAFTLSNVSQKVAQKVEPSEQEQQAIKSAEAENQKTAPTRDELQGDVQDVASAVAEGAQEVAQEAGQSISEHVQGEEKQVLAQRLKQVVTNLRRRTDYNESVSTLSLLIRRYLLTYSHAAADTIQAVEDDVGTNPEADRALHNFWMFVTSLGDKGAWKNVELSFKSIMEHSQTDPNFDQLVKKLANLVQEMLTNPDFFDNAEERFKEVRAQSKELVGRSSISEDVDALLANLHAAWHSVVNDQDVHQLVRTITRLAHILSPSGQYTNDQLVTDSINVFVPLLISAVQYLPIPRLEVATPAIDLLLENLILEPGRTVNQSSFLPYKLAVSTKNDVEVKKARFRTTSSIKSLMRVTIAGLSVAADDLGYWFRVHSGLLRFMDEGLAGFHVDEKGVDIMLDLEIGRDQMEKIVSLRNVKVKIHKLNYNLSKSKFACFAWLLKPLLRPIIRKALEIKMAAAIADGLHFLNREMLFARERLRATRIANPRDLLTFLRAVGARLVPAPDPDIDTRVGVKPGDGPFKGRYAPGSLVQLWEREGRMAEQTVYEYERAGWRNDIFDVRAVPA